MSKALPKSPWQNLTTYSFGLSVIALVFFNAYTTITTRHLTRSVNQTQTEVDLQRQRSKKINSLENRYYVESLGEIVDMESQLKELHRLTPSDAELFPILDREFFVTGNDGLLDHGERIVSMTVPKLGSHQIRIEITYKDETCLDRRYALQSGSGYRIRFHLRDNKLELAFPDVEPVNVEFDEFDFANRIVTLRNSTFGRSNFVSCNQPRWNLRSRFEATEHGVLSTFAFMSKLSEPTEHIRVRLTVESDGPPSAAADNPATVQHLQGLLDRGYLLDENGIRHEDGMYIFEKPAEN